MIKKINILIAAMVFTAAVAYAAPADLSETGQATCYEKFGNVIACAFTGQDGDLKKGVAWPNPRFTAGTGAEVDCVADNLTGLMWVKAPDSTLRTWATALTYANGLSLCGHNDWRLPNLNELESLVNAQETNTAAWLNTQGFSNVWADVFWSSTTTHASVADGAWCVNMWYGNVTYNLKGLVSRVWPVRAGQ